jgi:hypothetical protein
LSWYTHCNTSALFHLEYVERAISFFGSSDGDGKVIRLAAAILIVLWVSAIASAFIDNIPYTATMIPIILQISDSLSIELGPLIWALAFGACLGGNGTLIGASANVVTAGMSEEAGYPISFNEFFKAGFPIMLITTAIVSLYMILVFVVGGDDGSLVWKLVLMGITAFGIIFQLARGRSKGKNVSESLVDDDSEGIKELVDSLVGKVIKTSHAHDESEE